MNKSWQVLGSAGLMVGFNDLKGLFQPKGSCDSRQSLLAFGYSGTVVKWCFCGEGAVSGKVAGRERSAQ